MTAKNNPTNRVLGDRSLDEIFSSARSSSFSHGLSNEEVLTLIDSPRVGTVSLPPKKFPLTRFAVYSTAIIAVSFASYWLLRGNPETNGELIGYGQVLNKIEETSQSSGSGASISTQIDPSANGDVAFAPTRDHSRKQFFPSDHFNSARVLETLEPNSSKTIAGVSTPASIDGLIPIPLSEEQMKRLGIEVLHDHIVVSTFRCIEDASNSSKIPGAEGGTIWHRTVITGGGTMSDFATKEELASCAQSQRFSPRSITTYANNQVKSRLWNRSTSLTNFPVCQVADDPAHTSRPPSTPTTLTIDKTPTSASLNNYLPNLPLSSVNPSELATLKEQDISNLIPILIQLSDKQKTKAILWYEPTSEFLNALPLSTRVELQADFSRKSLYEQDMMPKSVFDDRVCGEVNWLEFCKSSAGVLSINAIAPNPAKSFVSVSFTLTQPRRLGVGLYTVFGNKVKDFPPISSEKIVADAGSNIVLDLGDTPAGTYLIALTTDEGETAFQRLLVEH